MSSRRRLGLQESGLTPDGQIHGPSGASGPVHGSLDAKDSVHWAEPLASLDDEDPVGLSPILWAEPHAGALVGVMSDGTYVERTLSPLAIFQARS